MSRIKMHNGHRRSVISYIGGKEKLINRIVPLIEYLAVANGLKAYLELTGGGCRMLLNTSTTLFNRRAYNDIDYGLSQLFKVLGDKEYLYELMALLEAKGATPEAFEEAKTARERGYTYERDGELVKLDPVTAGAYAYIVTRLSRASSMMSYSGSMGAPRAQQAYLRKVRDLDRFYPTLNGVECYNRDVFQWLKSDLSTDAGVLIYLDPPYVPQSMQSQDHYGTHSWSTEKHKELVDLLLIPRKSSPTVILSGYDNEVYTKLTDHGWEKLYLGQYLIPSSVSDRRHKEYVWINCEIPYSLKEEICEDEILESY